MREHKVRQLACIAEEDPQSFQDRVNAVLATKDNPEVILDKTRPYIAYILYEMRRDIPENMTEALEYFTGERYTCGQCPYLDKNPDKRRRWHKCRLTGERTRLDSPACEEVYKAKAEIWERVQRLIETIPYRD